MIINMHYDNWVIKYMYSKIPLSKPTFVLPESDLMSEVVLILNIRSIIQEILFGTGKRLVLKVKSS